MTPWTFDTKIPLNTQFTFGSLTFVVGKDEDLKMLPPGPAPEHPTPAPLSTSGSNCSGLDPFAGLYIRTTKLVRGIPIVTSTPLDIHRSTEFIFIDIVPKVKPHPQLVQIGI
jgi:hypothetical protein